MSLICQNLWNISKICWFCIMACSDLGFLTLPPLGFGDSVAQFVNSKALMAACAPLEGLSSHFLFK